MVLSLGTADLCIVGGYLILALWIGMVQSRKIKNMRDYAVADRQFTVPLLVATISATIIGGESTIGMVEKVVGSGLAFLIIFGMIGDPVTKLIIAQFIAPRMTQFQQCISVGDVMDKYYGQIGRVVTGISGALLTVGLMGAQISAMGNLFHYFLGVSHFFGAFIGCSIVILYSTFGGIRAVTFTDVLQFCVLIVAIPMACNVGLSIVGGYGPLFAAVPIDRFFDDSGRWMQYLSFFVVAVIPFINPAVMQRLLMARSSQELSKALKVSACIDIPFFMIIGLIGLTVVALTPNVAPSIAFPHFVDHFMPTGIKGLVIAGLLAVIMSTVDSYMNSASVTFVHDVMKPLLPRYMNDRRELIFAKLATFVLGSFAFVIATRYRVIMDIVLLSLNFWGPVVVVPLYAVIFSIKASSRSFIAGAAAGTLTVIGWLFFDLEKHLGFDGLIPGMVLNALFFFCTRTASERQTKIPESQLEGAQFLADAVVERLT